MARDWIRPSDQAPAEGQVVEISIFANSPNVSHAKRLGQRWFVEREIGGPYLMHEPAAAAYWRPDSTKSGAR